MNLPRIYQIIESLNSTELTFELTPQATIAMEGWIGAHFRNRILYFTEQIIVTERGETLREVLNGSIINKEHRQYKELNGAVPKGYVVKIDPNYIKRFKYTLKTDEPITFSIVLIGNMKNYAKELIEAIKLFASNGFHNIALNYKLNAITSYSMMDFMLQEYKSKSLTLELQTPVSLYHTEKKNCEESYQAKMNGFPSFYQIITSSIHRLIKMSYLYTDKAWDDKAEEYIKELQILATIPILTECQLQKMRVTTAPKLSSGISMKFLGYIGSMKWERDIEPFIALLQFSSKISIGNDVVYGMGQFEIKLK